MGSKRRRAFRFGGAAERFARKQGIDLEKIEKEKAKKEEELRRKEDCERLKLQEIARARRESSEWNTGEVDGDVGGLPVISDDDVIREFIEKGVRTAVGTVFGGKGKVVEGSIKAKNPCAEVPIHDPISSCKVFASEGDLFFDESTLDVVVAHHSGLLRAGAIMKDRHSIDVDFDENGVGVDKSGDIVSLKDLAKKRKEKSEW